MWRVGPEVRAKDGTSWREISLSKQLAETTVIMKRFAECQSSGQTGVLYWCSARGPFCAKAFLVNQFLHHATFSDAIPSYCEILNLQATWQLQPAPNRPNTQNRLHKHECPNWNNAGRSTANVTKLIVSRAFHCFGVFTKTVLQNYVFFTSKFPDVWNFKLDPVTRLFIDLIMCF